MPMLPNEKHERFAAELSRGVPQGTAYSNVYGKENKSYASKIARLPPVAERVKELRAIAQGIAPSSAAAHTPRSVSDLEPVPAVAPVVDTPLASAQHEKFARYLAQDMPAPQAYTQAGYQSNPKVALSLAESPLIADRVADLKALIAYEAMQALSNPYAEQAFESLEEMGVTLEYIAGGYKRIAEKAEDVGALNHAISALDKLNTLRELEDRAKTSQDSGAEDGVKLSDVTAMMKEMRLLQEQGAKMAPPQSEPKDITPEPDLPKRNDGNPFPLLTPPDEDF